MTRTDRVAIITGGARGVGRDVTRMLAKLGTAVVVGYARNQSAAEGAVEEVLAANGTALAVRGDVGDEFDVERLFAETTEAFGGVDVVVHAARQLMLGPLADCDLATFDALLRTNLRGAFLVNRQAARELRHGGAIVNISGALPGPARSADGASAPSGGGVEAMTRVFARELRGRDITVNAVASESPGSGTHAGIANVVAFLVSAAGHCVTGQVIRADDDACSRPTGVQ
jgi:3-oxoacyl-[acyl-carrier protein] reductase